MAPHDLHPTGPEWQRVYHDRRWSSLLFDAMDFGIAFLAASIGLVTMYFRIASLAGVERAQPVNVTGVWWLDDTIVLAIATAFASWGIQGMRRFVIDVRQRALIDEGRVDRVGVHVVAGSHGGYRLWTMTCGPMSWSMPYLDAKAGLDIVQPGMMVRVRYRPGSWSIADLWVLREVTASRSAP